MSIYSTMNSEKQCHNHNGIIDNKACVDIMEYTAYNKWPWQEHFLKFQTRHETC